MAEIPSVLYLKTKTPYNLNELAFLLLPHF
nr:MAG TPA: hypothetical protein [Caudoviricetes sp.]